MNTNPYSKLALIALLALVFTVPHALEAQTERAGARTSLVVDPSTGLPVPPEPIAFNNATEKKQMNVVFDNLPFLEVVKWLRQQFPEVNLVVPWSLRTDEQILVNLELRSAGLREILVALNIATDGKVNHEVRSPTMVAFYKPLTTPHERGEALPPAPPPLPPPTYQIINLREMLRIKDPAKLQQALDTIDEIAFKTLKEVYGGADSTRNPEKLRPRLNYHEGSGVLVVVGQTESIKIVTEIIRNLRMPESERALQVPPVESTPKPAPPTPPAAPTPPAPAPPGK